MIKLAAYRSDVYIDPVEIVAITGETNGLTLYTNVVLRNGTTVVVTTTPAEVYRLKETHVKEKRPQRRHSASSVQS